MSQQDVEIVRGAYEAIAGGDVDAFMSALDPAIDWRSSDAPPWSKGTYTGPEEVGAYIQSAMEHQDDLRVEASEFLDAGDRIIALGRVSATGKASGASFDVPFAHVWRVRDGKLTQMHNYTDTAKILHALEGVPAA